MFSKDIVGAGAISISYVQKAVFGCASIVMSVFVTAWQSQNNTKCDLFCQHKNLFNSSKHKELLISLLTLF